jgi:hypothetical protein
MEIAAGALERFGYAVESALTRKPWISPLLLSAAFLPCALVKASRRPFNFDEILTEYVAALPSFDKIWKALAGHAESSPPLFHLLFKLSADAFGWNQLGLRVPSILGYLTMMLCTYFMVRRYAGPLYGWIGALSTILTFGVWYGVQARPYALLLGCSSVALLCWQQVCRNHNRRWMLAGLWLSLATATSLHYFAMFSFAAIGFGEVVRIGQRRRIDWPIWGTLALAATPLLVFRPLLRANLVLKKGYFAPATLHQFVVGTSRFYLPQDGVIWAAFALLAGSCILIFSRRSLQPPADAETGPVYEWAALLALLLTPVEAFAAGKLLTGIFQIRYAIVTLIGFSILLPLCLQRLFRNSRAAALITVAFLLLCFGGWYALKSTAEDQAGDLATNLTPWLRAADASRLPIIVSNPLQYLRLAHSGGNDLKAVLVYTPDAEEALKYTGVNSGDYNLAGLRGLAPLNLPTYGSFTDSHREFLVLWDNSRLDWIVPKLQNAGAQLRLHSTQGERVLFLVDLPGTATPLAIAANSAADNRTLRGK